VERVENGSTEATPLVREDSGSEELHQTANRTHSIGSWFLNLFACLFSCFSSQTGSEEPSSNGLAERVDLPPPRLPIAPPRQILQIQAFNLGERHPLSNDRVDVYINGRQNMGAPLHELTGQWPYRSMTRTDKPLSITVEVSSKRKNYKIELPVLNNPGILRIEEITDSLFQVTVTSPDGSITLHSTRQMALVDPEVINEYFG